LYNTAPAAFRVAASGKFVILRPSSYEFNWTLMTNNTNSTACNMSTYLYKNAALIEAAVSYNVASLNVTVDGTYQGTAIATDYYQMYANYSGGTYTTSVFFVTDTKHAIFSVQELPGW